jgi:hypothetical protein
MHRGLILRAAPDASSYSHMLPFVRRTYRSRIAGRHSSVALVGVRAIALVLWLGYLEGLDMGRAQKGRAPNAWVNWCARPHPG